MLNNPLALLRPEFNRTESPYIEPGLLPVFRLSVGLQLGILLVSVSIATYAGSAHAWKTLALISFTWKILLLGYLAWPKLPRKLGRIYLPIALIVVSICPILERVLYIYAQMARTGIRLADSDLASINWQLYTLLLAPLVLMAWQYKFQCVFYFSLGTTLLSLVLICWLFSPQRYLQSNLAELSLMGATTFMVVGYIIVRMISAQHEQHQALIEANSRLVDYAATAEQLAVSRERNRLARDLHDTLAHSLSAVSVQLEAVDSAWNTAPEQAHGLLIKALATTRSGLAETRRAVQALRAAPLDDLGLALAIRTLAESIAKRTGAALTIDMIDEINLPPDLEQNIYRIAEEVLLNIAQHAHASQIKVMLGRLNDAIVLIISDNGHGFDPDNHIQAGHYGLQGLQERARLSGATLVIESKPGSGTVVRLSLVKSLGVQSYDSTRPV